MASSPSTAIEHRFYSILRGFGLLATTIALIAAIFAAVNGISKITPHTESVLQPPNATYEDFRRQMAADRSDVSPISADTTLQKKEEAAAEASAEAEFEKRLKPELDSIVADLGSYAAKTDQAKPSAQAVGDYVRTKMQRVTRVSGADTLAWRYVAGLKNATHELFLDSDRLSKLEPSDQRRVRWDVFLDWYNEQYEHQINVEIQRINSDNAQAVSNAAQAPVYFYVAAVAFGIFIFTTLLLLLLRIEANTRPSSAG